jgi:hypothetical protein
MKLFALFAVFLLVAQAPINAPRQGGNKQDQAQHDADTSKAACPLVTKPTTEFIPVFQAPKWEPKNDPTQQKPNYWKETFGPANLPNWALVVVGGIAGCLAWRTLNAINRQATQMAEQTKLQRGQMKQWVDFDKWESKDLWDRQEPELQVSFTLTNPTNFLLVLDCAEVSFSPQLPNKYLLVSRGTPLPPNKPLRVDLFVPLDTIRLGTFRTGTLGLVVESTIEFTNVLDEKITQHISGLLSCNSTESSFESLIKLQSPVRTNS